MATETTRPTTGQIIITIIWLVGTPVVLLWLSGDWLWIEAWIFCIWFLAVCLTTIIYLLRNDPALLVERFRRTGSSNQAKWDKYVLPAMQTVFVAWIIIMPLDARRYHWTAPFPAWLEAMGGLMLAASFFLMYRSFTDNTFASPLIRIQTERQQHVVTTGVYTFVRHPMYLGGILLNLGTPILLGSKYGILLGLVTVCILMLRIISEEKVLAKELEGYEEYRKKVKYRLVPHVW